MEYITISYSLSIANVEAIAPGATFEVTSRKGLKKRFLVEQVESHSKAATSLYTIDDATELILQHEASPPAPPPYLGGPISVPAHGLGGLKKEIEFINKRIQRLLQPSPSHQSYVRNGPILIHGHPGTGKSLLLNRVSQATWHKVITIDQSTLGATASKNAQTIRHLFDEAMARQPCLVIMDNLEAIASVSQHESHSPLAALLATQLDRISDTQVLVVAATPNLNDIDKSLRSPSRFRYELEVPIPDVKTRIEIMKAMHGTASREDHVAAVIGERTHGFVGQDLQALYNNAFEYALDRWMDANHRNESRNHNNGVCHSSKDTEDGSLEANKALGTSSITDVHATLDDYERALLVVRPTAMKEFFCEKPNVKWTDIGGSDDIKQVLDEVITWPLKYSNVMDFFKIAPCKGILFYGPPGCAKTLTAKAIATSSGLNFIAVKGAELTSMYVGESERAVREVFRKARAAAPSIIFFDEIDSIGSERDSTKGLNVLTTLLNEMDGFESLGHVLVLAATNKPEVLDSALLRPGRFDSLIYVAPPNKAARKEIIKIRTRSVPLAQDVDVDALSLETEGYSGAELVNICSEASRSAMRRLMAGLAASSSVEGLDDAEVVREVTKSDFDGALQKTVRRITPDMTESYEEWKNGVSNV